MSLKKKKRTLVANPGSLNKRNTRSVTDVRVEDAIGAAIEDRTDTLCVPVGHRAPSVEVPAEFFWVARTPCASSLSKVLGQTRTHAREWVPSGCQS